MLTINPPRTVPYAPATQPVAAVKLGLYLDPNIPVASLQVRLFDAKGGQIMVDQQSVPPFDKAAQTALLATATNPGELVSAWLERAALPYLKSAYGLAPTTNAPKK
jgi:hypothetical protein